MQEIGIESSVLLDIIRGRKTIEGRLGKPKFLKLREGDIVSLREDHWQDGVITESHPATATIQITQVLFFGSFTEMLDAIDYHLAIPSAKNAEEALSVYRQFYSEVDEKEYGVIAFEFKLASTAVRL